MRFEKSTLFNNNSEKGTALSMDNQNHQRNAGGLYPADSSSAKRGFGDPSDIFAGFRYTF